MSSINQYTIFPLGDSAATFSLGNSINEEVNKKMIAMSDWLRQNPFEGLKDLVVGYSSVTIIYDVPVIVKIYKPQTSVFEFVSQKLDLAYETSAIIERPDELVRIPVCYDQAFGYDLDYVARHRQLTIDDVVRLHSERIYRVFMIGFLPGFPYMARTDERITVSRKPTPRMVIEPGSVGLAGNQTGIYPLQSPGGWQIIGRTPLSLFTDTSKVRPLLKPGDKVEFFPISTADFERISQSPFSNT